VPDLDRDAFRTMSTEVVTPTAGDSHFTAMRQMAAYLDELIEDKRSSAPGDDLLSDLIRTRAEDGDRLSRTELRGMAFILLVAGHETTVNLLGSGTLALLRHPGQLRLLRENPGLIGTAVEELLRYDGPVERTARIPSADTTIDGRKIEAGEMVMPFIGAADRDPAQFPDPDRLDITRSDNRHVAFGMGIHFCLGAPLARVEGQIAINTLVQRLPGLALATEKPEYRQSLTLRGLTALHLAF
jgi:cytochrome P450